MKTNYIIKAMLTTVLALFFGQDINAQFKIVEVDPTADTVTIKNFGGTTQNVGDYRLCSLISYRTLVTQTTVVEGSLNLAPNAEVTVSIPGYLNDSAADLGLYLPTGNFGTAANMVDFMQWGSGGNGRESVAVTAGYWTAGTFINVSPPYQFNGGATDFGVGFWDTLLSVNDLNGLSNVTMYPNPASTHLNIQMENNSLSNFTYQVFDVLGKQVMNIVPETGSLSQIDISGLNEGLYLLKISSGDQTETKRFIKN